MRDKEERRLILGIRGVRSVYGKILHTERAWLPSLDLNSVYNLSSSNKFFMCVPTENLIFFPAKK